MMPGSAPRARRFRRRAAVRPVTVYDDAARRGVLSRATRELLDLARRVVDELLTEAAAPTLTLDERRGLVAIALEVDLRAAARTGTTPKTLEIAARGRAALAGDLRLGTEAAP